MALADEALGVIAPATGLGRAELEANVARFGFHAWSLGPFARGAYSYARPGGADAGSEFAAPLAATVFFAGEATAPPANGTVEGALASGRRAACELLAAWYRC